MPDPRIRPRDTADVEGEARAVFNRLAADGGTVPNMMRTLAARPEYVASLAEHVHTVMTVGEVPPLLKELLAVRVASLNHCRYCLTSPLPARRTSRTWGT